jgi:dinuclear metal center YbgI/SA1388 family protein
METTVSDIARLIEEIAPAGLAESWDNPGLQVGHMDWDVRKIMVSLDPGREVMENAAESSVDMLICHHPLLFRAVKKIDLSSDIGEVVGMAIRNRIAVFAAHTNLDSASGGLNDALAHRIGIRDLEVLSPPASSTPETASGLTGLGRVGNLATETPLGLFSRNLKKTLGIPGIRMTGHPDKVIRRVAVCTGSGGSLLENFFDSGADVFITGDVGYHDALTVRNRERAVIDIGHFGSEHIMVKHLGSRLEEIVGNRYPDVQVVLSDVERDPFVTI